MIMSGKQPSLSGQATTGPEPQCPVAGTTKVPETGIFNQGVEAGPGIDRTWPQADRLKLWIIGTQSLMFHGWTSHMFVTNPVHFGH